MVEKALIKGWPELSENGNCGVKVAQESVELLVVVRVRPVPLIIRALGVMETRLNRQHATYPVEIEVRFL